MEARYKYPRTPHVPWSPGASSDDRIARGVMPWEGIEVVVTEKMDGENTTLYRDGLHARSLDSGHHASRDYVKRLQARIASEIPQGWRICGENCYAVHSLAYAALPDYFLVFSIWDQDNRALSWDQTREWCALLGLEPVPELARGLCSEQWLRQLTIDPAYQEGWVLRPVHGFHYDDFSRNVLKYVRAGHVETSTHWRYQAMAVNGVIPDA